MHFDPADGLRLPARRVHVSRSASSWAWARPRASAMYDYLGYYDVCYIGDEVRNPGGSSRARS